MVIYHPILPSFHTTTKQHLPILQASEQLQEAFRHPPLIAFHRPRSLKYFLVRAILTPTPSKLPGNYPCGAPRCKTCPILKVTDEFSRHMTGQLFKVKFHVSCKSSKIVYLITCRRCGLQYVGETSQPLHARITGHRLDITHQRADVSPVEEHFNSGAHSVADIMVMVIELPPSRDLCL